MAQTGCRRKTAIDQHKVALVIAISLTLSGCSNSDIWIQTEQAAGELRIEPAPAGAPYDYTARIKNVVDVGYNPNIKEDRDRMAVRLLKGQCENPRVVGETQIVTGTYALAQRQAIDYLMQVKC